MDPKTFVRQPVMFGGMMIHKYVDDLSDEDLKMIPVEGMNPIAWQIGHLIVTERKFLEEIAPGSCPALPEGFAENHPRKPSEADPAKFPSKAEYLAAWDAQNAATLALIDGMTEAELDSPSPEPMRSMAGTVGEALVLMGNHTLMHVGQFVAVRRKLSKPTAM